MEEKYDSALQNLSSVHSTIGRYITKMKNLRHAPTEEHISIVNGLYAEYCTNLPKLSSICGSIELENCHTTSSERVLKEKD